MNFQGITVFTGSASWSDYSGSVGYEAGLWAQSNTQIFWSIPLFADSGNLQSAAAGDYNSYYTAAAQTIASSQPTGSIYIRPGWEFNGNWEPWSAQSDPASYVSSFQQFVDSYRSVSNRFVFVWTPNIGSSGMADVSAAYPGDQYVDVIGVDMYDDNNYQTNPTAEFNYFLTEPFGLNWLSQFSAEHGKPLAVPEWGVNGDNDAPFIQLADQWFQQNHVLFQSYWDSDVAFEGKLSDGSMPDAAAAYLAAFGPQAPVISGTTGDPAITDAQTVSPFSQVSVTDPAVGAIETVTVTLTDLSNAATDANGTLSGQGVSKSGTGVYTLSGSAAAVSAELDAAVFTPTAHQVAAGSSVTTDLTLSVSDGTLSAIDGSTSVVTTAVAAQPMISGTTGDPVITDVQTVSPFSQVSIVDPTVGAVETVAITLSSAAGAATDANGTLSGQGVSKSSTGVYTLSGSAAAVSAELDAVIFTPTAHQVAAGFSVTTDLTLSVSDGTFSAIDGSTSVVATAVGSWAVSSGTVGLDAVISGGEKIVISRGGVEDGMALLGGTALDYGWANEATISSGGVEQVEAGAMDAGARVYAGGELEVLNGAIVTSATLFGGEAITRGTAIDTTISIGGLDRDEAGGAESGAVVYRGGELIVSSGATLTSAALQGGEAVNRGFATGTMISIGGVEEVEAGSAMADQVWAGGKALVEASGIDTSAVVYASGYLEVTNGGTAVAAMLSSRSEIIVSSGGVASSATLQAGEEQVYGSATVDQVSAGGKALVESGGIDASALVHAFGYLEVTNGGTAVAAVVSSRGELIVSSGGVVSGATLQAGEERVYGSAMADQVWAGGKALVESGGIDTSALVYASGYLEVTNGGTAVAAVVSSRGELIVSAGGVVSGATTVAGGVLVDNGVAAYGYGIAVLAGTLSGSGELVEDGPGTLLVSSAASDFTGSAVINGGTIELAAAGALADTKVAFAASAGASATLKVTSAGEPARGSSFAGLLENFDATGDRLDLAGQAFVSGATATLSGTALTLSDGAYTARFTLGGTDASSYQVTNDGEGGTLIIPAGVQAQALITAVATFAARSDFGPMPSPAAINAAVQTSLAAPLDLQVHARN